MASHSPAPCMLATEFGMLVHVAVLAFRSLVLARGVERHDCPRRVLFVSSMILVTRICFCRVCMRLRTRLNQTPERTADRRENLSPMTSTLNSEAQLVLVSGRSSCSC